MLFGMLSRNCLAMLLCLMVEVFSYTAMAEQADKGLFIELTKVEQHQMNCRVIFLIDNKSGIAVESLSFEAVLFSIDGMVERFILLDFVDIPYGKVRARQFELENLLCGNIKQFLFNDITTCNVNGDNSDICRENLFITTSTNIGVLD